MSSSTERARAVVLALLMVGSVFGATIAFTGGAAATINSSEQSPASNATDVVAGYDDTQTINVSATVPQDGNATFEINVTNITDYADVTLSGVSTPSTSGDSTPSSNETYNPNGNHNVSFKAVDGGDGFVSASVTLNLDWTMRAAENDVEYGITQYNNSANPVFNDTESVSFDVLDGESPTASQSTNDVTNDNATINVTLTDDVAINESTIDISAVNQSGDKTVIVENGDVITGVNKSSTLNDQNEATETINVSVDLPDGTYNLSVAANDTSDNRFNTTSLGDNFTVTTTSAPTTLSDVDSSATPTDVTPNSQHSYTLAANFTNVNTTDSTNPVWANFSVPQAFGVQSISPTNKQFNGSESGSSAGNNGAFHQNGHYVNLTWEDGTGESTVNDGIESVVVSFDADQINAPSESGEYNFTVTADLDNDGTTEVTDETIGVVTVSNTDTDDSGPTFAESTENVANASTNATVNVSVMDETTVDQSTINVTVVNATNSSETYPLVQNGNVVSGNELDASTFNNSDDETTEYVNISRSFDNGTYVIRASANDTNANPNSSDSVGDGFVVGPVPSPDDLAAAGNITVANQSTGAQTSVNATLTVGENNTDSIDQMTLSFANSSAFSSAFSSQSNYYTVTHNGAPAVDSVSLSTSNEKSTAKVTFSSFQVDVGDTIGLNATNFENPSTADNYTATFTAGNGGSSDAQLTDTVNITSETSSGSGTPTVGGLDLTLSTDTLTANNASEIQATAQLTDGNGDAVSTQGVEINESITNKDAANVTVLNAFGTTNATGAATLNLTANTPGVTAAINASENSTGTKHWANATFTTVAAESSIAENTTFSLTNNTAGAKTNVTVSGQVNLTSDNDMQYMTFNATGADLSGATQGDQVTLSIQNTPYTDGFSTVKIQNDGNLSITLSNSRTVTDDDNVTVTIHNVTLPSTPDTYNTSLDLETSSEGTSFATFSGNYTVTSETSQNTDTTPPTFAESTNDVTNANATVNVSVMDDTAVNESTIDVNVTNASGTTTVLVENGSVTDNATRLDTSTFTNGTNEPTEYVNVTADLPDGDYTISASANDTADNENSTTDLGDGFSVTKTNVAGVDLTLNRTKLVADNQTVIKATAQLVDSNGNDVNESDVRITRNINNQTQANITRLKGFGRTNADGVATLTLKANTSGYQVTVRATEKVTGSNNRGTASFGTIPTTPTYDSNSVVASYDDDNDGTISSTELQSAATAFRGGSLDMSELQSAAAAFAS